MMRTVSLTIQPPRVDSPVIIGQDHLADAFSALKLSRYSSAVILCTESIAQRWLPELVKSVPIETHTIIHRGEEPDKQINSVAEIWESMLSMGIDRSSVLLSFGGGVIGDMGGFIASTYMRGIPFIQIPTTLLSMVDASIGGKTGINHGGIKNSVGLISQPIGVIANLAYLKTLPERQFLSGWAEIVKYGLIHEASLFETVTTMRATEFSPTKLIEIITESCEIKTLIVQADSHESGPRKKLNFGHTLGHALESISHEDGSPLTHGEAVAIGMIGESFISARQGFISDETFSRIEDGIARTGLPVRTDLRDNRLRSRIYEKMQHDKKTIHGSIHWTLLKDIGDSDYNIVVGESFINEAIEYIQQ